MTTIPAQPTGSPEMIHPPDTQYIVPFPYGSNVRVNEAGQPETYLTIMSVMAIEAAVKLQGDTQAKIVIPGETPFEDLPNTTTLMAGHAKRLGVASNSLVELHALNDGRRLNNTYLQAEAVAEYLDVGRAATVVALGYHLARVAAAAKAWGLEANFVAAETIFDAHGEHAYNRYRPVLAKLWKSELLVRVITDGLGLPKGQIPNYLINMTGARIIDVKPALDGGLAIQKAFAPRKRKWLLDAVHSHDG